LAFGPPRARALQIGLRSWNWQLRHASDRYRGGSPLAFHRQWYWRSLEMLGREEGINSGAASACLNDEAVAMVMEESMARLGHFGSRRVYDAPRK
jgi:hypothetical protein